MTRTDIKKYINLHNDPGWIKFSIQINLMLKLKDNCFILLEPEKKAGDQ